MKKIISTAIGLLISISIVYSQNKIDFENWKSNTKKLPNEVEILENVTTSNLYQPYIGLSVVKSSQAYKGNYAIALSTKKFCGSDLLSSFSIGAYNINYAQGDIIKENGGIPISSDNIRISFWAKADSNFLNNVFKVSLSIRRNNTFIMNDSSFTFLPTDEWKENTITLNYLHQNQDTLILTFYSIEENSISSLFIDELNIESNTSAAKDENLLSHIKISPTFITNLDIPIKIDSDIELNQKMYTIHSVDGSILFQSNVEQNNLTLPVLSNGVYILKINNYSTKILVQSN